MTKGKKLMKKTSFQVRDGLVKKDRNKTGMRKVKNTTLLRNDGILLVQCELGMQVHCVGGLVQSELWMPERIPPSFCNGVIFLSLSSLACFCPFYRSIPILK